MKPIYFLCSLLFTSITMMGQPQPLDTLYANERTTVSLFFPEPIRQGITGADHFVFTYNKETPQYLGLLKAVPGVDSNLLVITMDGQVYSYILQYKKHLSKLNYFIPKEASRGHEKGFSSIEKRSPEIEKKEEQFSISPNRITSLKRFCSYMVRQDKRFTMKRKRGIKLELKNIVHRREVYMSFATENKSGIDFEVEYLRVYVVNGNKRKNASYQKILKEPIYRYAFPKEIKDKQRKDFVLVFPKFTLGKQEKLLVELGERNGHRMVKLKLK